MATNPMQRKARNSFLLGMLLTMVILGAIIVLLFMQMNNMKKQQEEEKKAMVKVYTLNQKVSSGQVITTDMFAQETVNRNTVPANATSDISVFSNYALQDENGNSVITKYEGDVAKLYLKIGDKRYELKTDDGGYYIEKDNKKEDVKLTEHPLVAKVDMEAHTVITTSLITKSDNLVQDDTRKQEYNMIILPSDLETGDIVDVRLMLPTGTDYIVVAKKGVEILNVAGMDSTDTISLNLNEDEINVLSNAIVDAAKIKGAKLYVNKYTEPGLQAAAIPTFPVNYEVLELINGNPNILEEARAELWNRYNAKDSSGVQTQAAQRTDVINALIEAEPEKSKTQVETNMTESITKSITTRQRYLEGLSSAVPVN